MENLYRQRTSTSLWFSLKRKKSLARPCISRYDRENVYCLVLAGRAVHATCSGEKNNVCVYFSGVWWQRLPGQLSLSSLHQTQGSSG